MCRDTEKHLLAAVRSLDALGIERLSPTAANVLYFLHPTIAPPFSTAMVNRYNALTGANAKLESWIHFLARRADILDRNSRYRDLLSNVLGAVAGLRFDEGSGR